MHPKNLSIQDFTYNLPEERIAQFPLENRDASRLLVYNTGSILHRNFNQISNYIEPGSLMIFNNTKVIPARVYFQKKSGGLIEVFCLEPSKPTTQNGTATWKCMVGGASKWKKGQTLQKELPSHENEFILTAELVERTDNLFIINFSWCPASISFFEVLETAGALPIPPYLKRSAATIDKVRYQTVYSRLAGSVAAPTAGLHFTPATFEQITAKNISIEYVTLHVGAGTFAPVKALHMQGHSMHGEYAMVELKTIEHIIKHLEKRIVAVGTTSMRTLESLYWLGLRVLNEPNVFIKPGDYAVEQWEPYEQQNLPGTKECLLALVSHLQNINETAIYFKTHILIAPGYKTKVVNSLVTNFHQPQSTLLLLVAASIGENWKKIYEEAFQNGYRFLSYGDSSLLHW